MLSCFSACFVIFCWKLDIFRLHTTATLDISPPSFEDCYCCLLVTCLMAGYIISVKSLCSVKLLVFLLGDHSLGYSQSPWDDNGFGRLSLTFFFPDHTRLLSAFTYLLGTLLLSVLLRSLSCLQTDPITSACFQGIIAEVNDRDFFLVPWGFFPAIFFPVSLQQTSCL